MSPAKKTKSKLYNLLIVIFNKVLSRHYSYFGFISLNSKTMKPVKRTRRCQ